MQKQFTEQAKAWGIESAEHIILSRVGSFFQDEFFPSKKVLSRKK